MASCMGCRRAAVAALIVVLANFASLAAPLRLSALFTEGMVLQHGQPVPVWGWADPGQRVSVVFGSYLVGTTAADDRTWRVELPAQPPNSTPQALEIEGTGGLRVTIPNVLVGEVWLCSGPSNLFWPLSKCDNAAEEMAGAGLPGVRFFTVEKDAADLPRDDCAGSWTVCSPETVGPMSGIAYFFARRIHEVEEMPIGILQSFWGGSRIEAWTSREALEAVPAGRLTLDAWSSEAAAFESGKAQEQYESELAAWKRESDAAKQSGSPEPRRPAAPQDPATSPHRPACLFNGMIAPLIPYGIRGAIIYQGLGNLARSRSNTPLLQAQIVDWRHRWGLGSLPFGLIQPSPYDTGGWPRDCADAYSRSRYAQQEVAGQLPNIGIALTMDVDAIHDLHFTQKQIPGGRIANWALSEVYEHPEPYLGPVFSRMAAEDGKLRVWFDHAEHGLSTSDGKPPAHFFVGGSDHRFHPAVATIDEDSVIVACPEVTAPEAVQFAWGDTDVVNLVNSDGLPASLFVHFLDIQETARNE